MAMRNGTQETGLIGENLAIEYLQKKGCTILQHRFRGNGGEVDVIAREPSGVLLFVEVKTRRGIGYGTPAESVTPAKQRKIVNAAMAYLHGCAFSYSGIRFDVIEVMLNEKNQGKIHYIDNAFGR